jgi:EpsI family protein
MKHFLSSKYARALTLVLMLQAVLFYTASRGEKTPSAMPLSGFPTAFGNWHVISEGIIEKEELDVLKADDVLTRVYGNEQGAQCSLFIAYFKTQRTGQSPHSPKNCLPGAGWQPVQGASNKIDIPVGAETLHINHFLVSRGNDASLVLYWYQSQGRVIADEFAAKFYLIEDSIRKHRSDTSLVRVVVPAPQGLQQLSDRIGTDFVKSVYPVVKGYLPQ